MEDVKGTSQRAEGNTSYWRGLGPEATDPRKDKRVAVSRFLGGLTWWEERRRAYEAKRREFAQDAGFHEALAAAEALYRRLAAAE